MAVKLGELQKLISEIVDSVPVVDIHTHLYPTAFGGLLLRGIDELLTYHYLIAETLRYVPEKAEEFWSLPTSAKADLVWRTLFVERSPVSEACRGVLTTLNRLGLDVASRRLKDYREFFAGLDADAHMDLAFKASGVKRLVMTNDPFDPDEATFWEKGFNRDPRMLAALRLDRLLNDWPSAAVYLRAKGYSVSEDLSGTTLSEVRRFLGDAALRMEPVYLSVSLPPTFAYPEESPRGRLLDGAVLPFSREVGRPLALMIGVKKRLNPALALAGDGVGRSDIGAVERLCVSNPDNRFLVTMLSRENQHELAVAARKFANLMVFGCWWFMNNPSLVEEITRMRVELLGLSFIPQHSDARVLDQLVYKWAHSRAIITKVLCDKYGEMMATGWVPTKEEIRRDVERLFEVNFIEFAGVR